MSNKIMRIIDHGSTNPMNPSDPHVKGYMVRTDDNNKIMIEFSNIIS